MVVERPLRDAVLVQIVDSALADAAARSGEWLVCAPGCTQCCHGVFAISMLDALRLRDGLTELEQSDPARARAVRGRAEESVRELRPEFPGDGTTGILGETEHDQASFGDFANDVPCPALDPAHGTCDLYAARPLTCRIFGPPVLSADGLGMCELCFLGASEAQIAAAEMHLCHGSLEDELTEETEAHNGLRGQTIVAYALLAT